MKKFIVLLLTLAMVMSLVACGKKNEENSETGSEEQVETAVENNDVADVTEPEAATDEEEIPEGDNAEVEETTAYNFKGYTETADWPGEDCWTSYGLPNLVFDEDVSGIVHISDKDWIYPLNGSDGIMIEARITTPHLDELMEILNNSGVTLEEDDEYINGGYSFYYQNNGTKMKLQLAEWEIDVNDYKIQITIITDPTD